MDLSKNEMEKIWLSSWCELGLNAPESSVFEDVLARYSETHRYYHTLQHLSECFSHRAWIQASAAYPAEVYMAIWFHDLIYDVRAKDNETRSAQFAADLLSANGASHSQISRISQHIIATSTHQMSLAEDSQFLLDVDLAILGASPARFSQYQEQIRSEYAYVPSVIYRFKRKEVLASFLARESIYLTPHFQYEYEETARENLRNALAS